MPILYHYCPLSTFPKIISNQKIWLTSYTSLNDTTETTWATNEIYSAMNKMVTDETKEFFDELNLQFPAVNHSAGHVYVTSFSTSGDVLSQWRAYASDGSGFAIGFDSEKLGLKNHIPNMTAGDAQNSIGLIEMKYCQTEMATLIRTVLNHGISRTDLDKKSAAFDSAFALKNLCRWFKNPAFEEEKEWRILYTPFIHTDAKLTERPSIWGFLTEMKFRDTCVGITPYFELPFPRDAIKEVVLGPKNPSEWVNFFLDMQGFHGIKVYRSKATYR